MDMNTHSSNLRNPMLVDEISIDRTMYSDIINPIIETSLEMYQLIQIKDPNTIYVIINSTDNRYYIGDRLVLPNTTNIMYTLGPGDIYGEYTLYINIKDGVYDRLVPIAKYDNPQKAINALNKFNKVGMHTDKSLQVYAVLNNYINRNIGINDAIIGIIALFGYRDSIQLQELIQITISYGATESKIDLPNYFKQELMNLRNLRMLVNFYSKIYDVISYYNFFKDVKYQEAKTDLDLSDVISRIYKIM